jgi:hypothetical protein
MFTCMRWNVFAICCRMAIPWPAFFVIPTVVEETLGSRANCKRCLDPFDFAQGKSFARHDKKL